MIVLAAAAVLALSDATILGIATAAGAVLVAIVSGIFGIINHKLNRQHDATTAAVRTAATAATAVQAVKDEVTTNHGKRLGKHIEDLVDAIARLEAGHADLKMDVNEIKTRAIANASRIEFVMKLWGDTTTDQAVKDQAIEDALSEVKSIIDNELKRGDKAYRFVVAEQRKLRETLEAMRGDTQHHTVEVTLPKPKEAEL